MAATTRPPADREKRADERRQKLLVVPPEPTAEPTWQTVAQP